MMPRHIPEALSKYVVIIDHVYANHAGKYQIGDLVMESLSMSIIYPSFGTVSTIIRLRLQVDDLSLLYLGLQQR